MSRARKRGRIPPKKNQRLRLIHYIIGKILWELLENTLRNRAEGQGSRSNSKSFFQLLLLYCLKHRDCQKFFATQDQSAISDKPPHVSIGPYASTLMVFQSLQAYHCGNSNTVKTAKPIRHIIAMVIVIIGHTTDSIPTARPVIIFVARCFRIFA